MKKLFFNCLIFSFPLLICLGFFIGGDPFGIFYKDVALADGSADVIKTRNYLRSFKEKKYSTFTFGNSRTNAITTKDLQKHLGNEAVFHFGCPGESLLNVRKKLEMIVSYQNVKNVIILVDAGILENTDNKHHFYQGPVYNHTPLTSDISTIQFYANYIHYYFSDYFFAKHIYYAITSNYKENWMKSAFKDPKHLAKKIDSHNYETLADSLIETDFKSYKIVFNPDYSFNEKKLMAINLLDSIHLVEIKNLLETKAINYKIIIPPDFHKNKIPKKIYNTLHAIMGSKLYDFTGLNKITTDSSLNYENLHFTTKAGKLILDSIYK